MGVLSYGIVSPGAGDRARIVAMVEQLLGGRPGGQAKPPKASRLGSQIDRRGS
jgi:hypothetical protein